MDHIHLTEVQTRLFQILSERLSVGDEFIYKSECPAHLPSVAYHWITSIKGNIDIDQGLQWSNEDLIALIGVGFIQLVESTQDELNHNNITLKYKIHADNMATYVPDDLTEHPSYGKVLKAVLWDECRDELYFYLSKDNVSIEVADLLYEHARNERISSIRSECITDILKGFGYIIGSIVVFCIFAMIFHYLPWIIIGGCLGALGIGLWKLIDGFGSYLFAPKQRGSISDF